jgi:DNA-directed RNA polymerase
MQTDLAGVERQLALETASLKLGQDRLTAKTDKAEAKGRGSQTLYGNALCTNALESVAKEIRAKLNNLTRGPAGRDFAALANLLGGMDPDILALLAMKVALDTLTRRGPRGGGADPCEIKQFSTSIAHAIQTEARLTHYRTENPGLYKKVESNWHSSKGNAYRVADMTRAMRKQSIEWSYWSSVDLVKVGSFILSCLINATGWIYTETTNTAKYKRVTHARLTNEFLGVRDHIMQRASELAYIQWPMLVPPIPWTATERGGYLTAEARKQDLVRGYNPFTTTPHKQQGHLPLEMLNNLQNVAYRINPGVMEVARKAYEDWRHIGSFRRAAAIEPKNWLGENPTDEEKKEWRRYRTKVENENSRNAQHNWRTTEVMFTAEKFADETFWLPWNFDYRGRVYTLTTSLSPQGTDFDKSLFYFAEEGPINEYWLLWQAATAWGLDKKSHDERVQWARENMEMFTIIAQDPYGAEPCWGKASEPWVFLAAALEVHACLIAKTKTTSGLPIGIDATCSGLQHLSALTLNRSAAEQVNVVPTPQPSDGYRTVAEASRKYLPKSIGEWIDRKVTKRTVMTLCYGVTRHSARGYIHAALQEAGREDKEYLSQIVEAIYKEAVPEVFPGPIRVMEWLKRCAREIIRRGADDIRWTTPSGFAVHQFRNKMDCERVRTRIMGSVRSMSCATGPGTPDAGKHAASLPPNLIHSLDASLLHFMFSVWNRPFTCIHDCILGRSCDMDDMQRNIRLHFVEMYKGDPLQDWADQLEIKIPKGIVVGDLDLDQVNDSHYFFC